LAQWKRRQVTLVRGGLHGDIGQALLDRKLGRRFAFSYPGLENPDSRRGARTDRRACSDFCTRCGRDSRSGEAWQSGHALHRREELHALCDCVSRAAASVLQFLRIGESAIEITGCWANLYAPGAAHRAHSHPNSFLSAVYYVRTGPGADSINFHDPRSQAGVIRPPVTELTAANTDQVVVRVKDGTLLVFPSYLYHSVDTHSSGEIRVSPSFNLMFSSFTAALSRPLWGDE
jgi:uncharacterized protein (TIGR02466 family)